MDTRMDLKLDFIWEKIKWINRVEGIAAFVKIQQKCPVIMRSKCGSSIKIHMKQTLQRNKFIKIFYFY
jgi:hypothetical protein